MERGRGGSEWSHGPARMEWGWSEGEAKIEQGQQGLNEGWEGCTNLIPKTIHSYSHCLHFPPFWIRYPLPFSVLHGCFLFSPSRSCSKKNVRGWKGGEESKEMKKRRGLSEVGVMGGVIMKGRAEGWGMVRWKERNIFLQVPVKLLSLFSVSLEIAFRISSLKIRYPHSKLSFKCAVIYSFWRYPYLAFVHVLFESILNSNWTCLFRFLLKFACKDQFPSSFSLKLFPMFVRIVLFRHAPKTAAPL